MMMTAFVLGFGAVATGAALLAVAMRNLLHALLAFLVSLLAVAGLFVLAGAEFVGVSQLMIYVGGVVVILAFGLMMAKRETDGPPINLGFNRYGAMAIVGTLFCLLCRAIWRGFPVRTGAQDPNWNNVQALGIYLMTDYLLVFEAVGILLLVALVGAVIFSWRK
jgi:NADH-quinone oxidoreductase subunit J